MSLPLAPSATVVVTISIVFDPTKLRHPAQWDWSHIFTSHHATITPLQVVDQTISAANLFSLSELHDLIFNNTIAYSPRSLLPQDHPTLPVRVIPAALASRIQALDPEEKFFHLEFFPPHPYVDLWSTSAWNNSLSKRLKNNAAIALQHAHSPLARRENLIHELTVALRELLPSLTNEQARKFSIYYLASPLLDDALISLGIRPPIIAAMQELRKLLAPEDLVGTADASVEQQEST